MNDEPTVIYQMVPITMTPEQVIEYDKMVAKLIKYDLECTLSGIECNYYDMKFLTSLSNITPHVPRPPKQNP